MNETPQTAAPAPPLARRIPRVSLVHGETRVDDYFWLRDKVDPEVAAYLEAENAYTAARIRPTEPFQETLYKEMLGRIQETDLSAPYADRGFFYYRRTEEGKQYGILCRKQGSLEATEQVTLDLNRLAEGHTFFSLGAYAVSDDGELLAYSTDVTGFREYTLYVKDLRSGELRPERIELTGSLAWAKHRRTLFYTTDDAAKRPYRLWRWTLGEAPALVYEEADERFRVGVARSRSREYLFLVTGSHTTTEVSFLSATEPEGEWRLIAAREQDHEYDADHHAGHFYIRTNDRGRNFRLARTPIDAPGRESWSEVVPHRIEVMLEGVEPFAGRLVLLEREGGLPQLRVLELGSGDSHRIAFPEPTYSAGPGPNAEFETTAFRYVYESLVTPPSVYDYDMAARASTLRKQQPVLGGYDSARYVSERLDATAPDGTRVPISIVYRRDPGTSPLKPGASPLKPGASPLKPGASPLKPGASRPRDGGPLLLTGYGSYGYPYPVGFNSNRLSLLDRGLGFAIAHVRGGGDLGKPWHDQGRMLRKRTTFTDFIACAEALIAQGYTSPQELVIEGGSAGGLLMGAVVNLRPELFRAVVSKVPFVDVVNSMLDESLPLTVGEFEEWGNPKKQDEYAYLRSYCPYTNLEAKAYPAMLVKTAFNDSQVMYWEPAKYVAKLRTLKTDANPLLLHTNMNAGHGGASGRYDYLREVAFDYAFLLWQLGLGEPGT